MLLPEIDEAGDSAAAAAAMAEGEQEQGGQEQGEEEGEEDWDLLPELNAGPAPPRRPSPAMPPPPAPAQAQAQAQAGEWADLGVEEEYAAAAAAAPAAADSSSVDASQGEEEGEGEEVLVPRSVRGEGSTVCWIYKDSWGNEIAFPPPQQALLEREWRAGRESAHLQSPPPAQGCGSLEGEQHQQQHQQQEEERRHYTVLFASDPEQHVQVNRLTGTRRRVKRLARLPRAPRGLGGWALAVKARRRDGVAAVASLKELGPGAVSRAAAGRARAAGRALVRRAPSREAVARVGKQACMERGGGRAVGGWLADGGWLLT